MAGITLAMAEERLAMWLEAEEKVATSQSYRIGTRELTRVDLPEIRKQILFWETRLEQLSSGRGRGARVMRVIPRDL